MRGDAKRNLCVGCRSCSPVLRQSACHITFVKSETRTMTAAAFGRRKDISLQAFAERSFDESQEKPFDVVWPVSPKVAADAPVSLSLDADLQGRASKPMSLRR